LVALADLRTVILCGGKGTRAYPHTETVPKPLLEVAGIPVLRHVMEIYAGQGLTSFVLAAGYKAEMVQEFARRLPRTWSVDVVDTGEDTNTGARVRACRGRLGDPFLATYGDGLGDVDLAALVEFHRIHPGCATLTTVPLRSQYGTVDCTEAGRVRSFLEKPVLEGHWINAGYFVFDQAAFAHGAWDDLERDALPALGEAGRLYAFRHLRFWRSLDTYKDALELTALCGEGMPPWMTCATPASC
jgi:glucose-1-phosphate cytidylyltransferase